MTDIRAQDAVEIESDGGARVGTSRSKRETTWRWEPSQPNASEGE
ncbi:hypothetical protein [Halogranum rubrum]|uniref:Uncharacterized protein n=1 Tax=Halogranum salarium B-1 TaxID=1210908 RepID=J3JD53_9EURY|nr:hypothetical protein [Halogranum salarium]EJN57189.1 hypothetical protein HSB1_45750 [Halogranum salarium B-1]